MEAAMSLISCFDLNCIIPGAVRRSGGDSPGNAPGVWSLSFKLDQNVAPLFPYINGGMEDALWYEHPGHIRFLYEDYRCLLYPEQASAHFFETRADAQSFAGRFTDLLNSIDARKEDVNYPSLKSLGLKKFKFNRFRNCFYRISD
jgi:hypothetical protein